MLIIFDVDGTLIGGKANDWSSLIGAIHSVLGFMPTREFFETLPDVTTQTVAEAAVAHAGCRLGTGLEEQIRDDYFARLKRVHAAAPDAFPARPGVHELLNHLDATPGLDVAIATGDWHPSITYKLKAAGIDTDRFPMATASDARRRADIIQLSAQRAKRPISEAIYVGDGLWDHRTCRKLGIPFIGTGVGHQHLRDAGARHIIETFEVAAFMSLLEQVAGSATRQEQAAN